MTKNVDLAQDFTHDIFLKVLTNFDSFSNKSKVSTWLYAITYNYCIDQLRISKRIHLDSLSDALAETIPESVVLEADNDFPETIQQTLKQLSAEDAALLNLKYVQNCSIKELAERYQVKENAMKMRLKRSRERLAILYYAQHPGSKE